MESDIRENRWDQAGRGRGRATANAEKSPGGSVKRARQRAAAGLPPERPEIPPSPILTDSSTRRPPKVSSPHENQYPQYPSPGSYHENGPHRPRKGLSSPGEQEINPIQESNKGRGPAPPRPPRPNYVPPLLESTRYHDPSPQFQKPPPDRSPRNYWEGDSPSFSGYSSDSRPTTATASSPASIPDFPLPSMPPMPSMPVPTYQPPPRRNLGPPPSARKAASSYYSQSSFVPPIPEEMSDSHSSYASSHVPVSWGNGPPDYYTNERINEDEDDETVRDFSVDSTESQRPKASDHEEATNLMKKSGRKPLQPFMDAIESGDESDMSGSIRHKSELDWQATQDERFRSPYIQGRDTDPIGRHTFKSSSRLHPYSGYESDATFLDSPISASPGISKNFSNDSNGYFATPSDTGSPLDPRVGEIIGHLEKGGALVSSESTSPSPPITNEKGGKRPPRLNLLQGSKGTPARGSATSLPELIRRATRLASNLDRGKTASRIGMLEVLNANDKEKRERGGKSRDGSISDMLAAFPSPTPTASPGHRPSNWPPTASLHGKSNLSRTHTVTYGSTRSEQRERRCCGMPVWAFILLIIIILLLIAAAVVIPVTLVVIPKQNNRNGPSLSDCKSSNPCSNGGFSIVINKACRCICTNSYTGSSCTDASDGFCTTADIPASGPNPAYNEVTVGSDVARILTAAQTNYSIPLDGATVASLFNVNNLSCASENGFVSFAQKSTKRDLTRISENDLLSLDKPPSLDNPPSHKPFLRSFRQLLFPSPTSQPQATRILHPRAPAAQTSVNGIIFAAPSGDVPGSPASPTSTPSTPVANGKPITSTTLDFARTAMLFIFQVTSSLEITDQALAKLQPMLNPGIGGTFDASQTAVAGNITVDLELYTVSFGNGTTFGEKGGR